MFFEIKSKTKIIFHFEGTDYINLESNNLDNINQV